MSEALTDVTGGIVERFELGRKAPADLQNIMLKAFKKSSLMGCSIDVMISRLCSECRVQRLREKFSKILNSVNKLNF